MCQDLQKFLQGLQLKVVLDIELLFQPRSRMGILIVISQFICLYRNQDEILDTGNITEYWVILLTDPF